MMLLLTSMLFSGLLMTQADQIIDDLSVPPLNDLVYIFDVRTEAPVSDVKAALSGVGIRHSVKIIGEERYLFVVTGNSAQELRDLTFPADSAVTQYPVEHIEDFFRLFDISSNWDEGYDVEGLFENVTVNFMYIEFTFPEDVTAEQYFSLMQALGENFASAHEAVKPVLYAGIGSYPPNFFLLTTLEENALQNEINNVATTLGGPSRITSSLKQVVTV